MHSFLSPRILLPLILAGLFLPACTTISNRRDLYFPQTVDGPYTKIRRQGLPKTSPESLPAANSTSDGKKVIKPRG